MLGLDDGAKRQPNGLLIRCVWHNDANPSLSITVGDGGTLRGHCFGCNRNGDTFDLIAAAHGLDVVADFPEILDIAETLTGECATTPTPGRGSARPSVPARATEETARDVGDFHDLATILLTHCPIDDVPEVGVYLTSRRLLGGAREEGWGALPSDAAMLAELRAVVVEAVGEEAWLGSGLVNDRGDLTWLDHRVLIPWRDRNGIITTIERRVVGAPVDEQPRYIMPAGRKPAAPYGADGLSDLGPATAVVFVEGAADTLALRALYRLESADRFVVGLPGVAGWRREWAELARGRDAVIAVDADDAGEGRVEALMTDLYDAGAAAVWRATPGHGKDWGELLERSS